MSKENRVRLVLEKKIDQRHGWNIPIEKKSDNFLTGQELSVEKKRGLVPLTKEEREDYPFVINPDNPHKGQHMKWYSRDIPQQNAILLLMVVSLEIAPSKDAYEKATAKYRGYLYDEDKEEQQKTIQFDDQYKAYSLVMDSSFATHIQMGMLLLNSSNSFNINPHYVSQAVLRNKLIEIASNNPKEIMNCIEKHNPGVEKELRILNYIDSKILTKKDNGDIYHMVRFLGSNVPDVVSELQKSENETLRSKLAVVYEQKQKGEVEKPKELDADRQSFDRAKGSFLIAIHDKDIVVAKNLLEQIKKMEEGEKELSELQKKYDELLKVVSMGNQETKLKARREELMSKNLKSLNSIIKYPNGIYESSECKDFKEDKEKLIDYMIEKETV